MALRKRQEDIMIRLNPGKGNGFRMQQLIWKGVLAGLIMMGCLLAYLSLVPLEGAALRFLLICTVGGLLGCFVSSILTVLEPHASWFPAGIAAIVAVINGSRLYRGFLGTLNYLISWWNIKQEDGKLLFQLDGLTEQELAIFAAVAVLLTEMLVWNIIRHRWLLRLNLLLLAILFPGVVLGRFSPTAFAALITAGCGIWQYRIHEHANGRRSLWVIGVGGCFLAAAMLTGNKELSQMTELRAQLGEGIEKIRFGEDTLPEGNLYRAELLHDGEQVRLLVTTHQAKNLYLRGFVGADYEQGQWNPLSKAAFGGEQNGMLPWLKEQGFVPARQFAIYETVGNSENQPNTIHVQNTGARRNYLYLPYSMLSLQREAEKTKQDGGFVSGELFGSRIYEGTELSDALPAELLHLDDWLVQPETEKQEQYIQQEQIYRDFVYGHYLGTDVGLEPLIRRLVLEDEAEVGGIYATVIQIRKGLENHMNYVDKPEKIPENVDPLHWFLGQSRSGNAVLYASAAVQAFRLCGIPARYAEGYLMREQQALQAEKKVVMLTSKDSHAWCEVYMDGIGWIPVDVTPGYYYDTYALIRLLDYPKGIQQTSAEEDSEEEADQILKQDQTLIEEEEPEQPQHQVLEVCLGIWVLAVTVLVILLLMAEMIHALTGFFCLRHLGEADSEEQSALLCDMIQNILRAIGIDAQPGWQTRITEEQLRKKLPLFDKGEYVRVSQVMERFLYGGQQLEAYEKRVLAGFLKKVEQGSGRLPMRDRLRLRYFWLFHNFKR